MADDPEKAGSQQGGSTRFKRGTSGNPRGKRPGTLNKATQLTMKLLAGDADAVVRRVIQDALAGEPVAQRLVIDRLCPMPRAARYVTLDLPKLETPADLVRAAAVITAKVAAGRLALEDIAPLTTLIEATAEAVRINDHDERIQALERFAEDRRLRAVG